MSQSSCLLFGYARVSTQDQNLDLQLDDLTKAGCQRVFQEKVSSAKARPQLQKMLDILREGDTVIVWKLDRLGRSLKELFTLVDDFQRKGIGFRSLNDAIDRHNYRTGPASFQSVCLSGRVRTRHDSGANQSRLSSCSCQGPGGWPSQGRAFPSKLKPRRELSKPCMA